MPNPPTALFLRKTRSAFTLVELLIVIGIIAILLVAVLPVVNSLSKSNGRKAAIGNLLGAIEQARAEAIKSGQATYVVFPDFSSSGPQATLDRYDCKSYAIFEDAPAGGGAVNQLTNWKTLPVGIAMRVNKSSTSAITSLPDAGTLPAPTPSFTFTPDANHGPAHYYLIKFNSSGELDAPASSVLLGLFEGSVSNDTESFTAGKDKNGNPLASEYLTIAHLTGRAEPTATPTP